jgi:hypothetical protein
VEHTAHTDYYVALVDTAGADVLAGPFETHAEAAAVCRRSGGAGVGRAPQPQPTSPIPFSTAAAGGTGRRPVYAVVSGAELRAAWALGLVYRW